MGEHPTRLVDLTGHASKQMVYGVYGRYAEGLEADREAIAQYFRTGSTGPRRGHPRLNRGESHGESRRLQKTHLLKQQDIFWRKWMGIEPTEDAVNAFLRI